MGDPYVVAGVNLRQFVADWLSDVEADVRNSPPDILLREAANPDNGDSTYSYGAHYLMSKISPRVWGESGSPDEVLLFAVMATYQAAEFPEADHRSWDGFEAHVGRAFQYMREVGELEAASRLRADVMRRTGPDQADAFVRDWLNRSMKGDPVRIAKFGQDMAAGSHRELRAADALDPAGAMTFDDLLS